MGVKAFMSGVESQMHFDHCVRAGVKHVLMSYWQFRGKNPGLIKQRKKSQPSINIMVDSGAHTFITEWQKFKGWTQNQFSEYAEEYVKWIYDNRKWIFCAVECDIDFTLNMVVAGNANSSLGASVVAGWQKDLFLPLQRKGIEIIYVWHEPRGMEGWEEMCSRFGYVGLPGHYSSEADFNKYMAVARRYTTKVHGFAATKQLDFRDVPWFSIDSITWKTGEMYGTLIDWDERSQRLHFEDDKTKRGNYRQKLESLGFDADGIITDTNYKEVTRYGLFSMRRMEAFYEQRYKDRLFYYELRLPHPNIVRQMSPAELRLWWSKFRPEDTFKQHLGKPLAEILEYLAAISAVQNGFPQLISGSQKATDFLAAYFPQLVKPLVLDFRILQRELATFTSPPNPPPLPRLEPSFYVPINSPPKLREETEFSPEDLEFDDPGKHFLAEQL